MQRAIIIFLISLAAGAGLGAGIGWLIPIQEPSNGFDSLSEDYKADYTVMVGAAYAVSNDWDAAQARLGRLAEADPAAYVVSLTETYITQGRSPDDIRNLVRLAARFGYITPPMQPYLPPSGTTP
jgi:hypothetical protein